MKEHQTTWSWLSENLRLMMTYVLYNMCYIYIYIYMCVCVTCVCCRYLPLIAASPTTLSCHPLSSEPRGGGCGALQHYHQLLWLGIQHDPTQRVQWLWNSPLNFFDRLGLACHRSPASVTCMHPTVCGMMRILERSDGGKCYHSMKWSKAKMV